MLKHSLTFSLLLSLTSLGFGQEGERIENMRDILLNMKKTMSSIASGIDSSASKSVRTTTSTIGDIANDGSKKQASKDNRYKRISIYSLITSDQSKPYNVAFINAFGNASINLPEKINDHNVGEYIIPLGAGENIKLQIEDYLSRNNVAKDLVAAWFRRDRKGTFNISLVADRGAYDASYLEQSIAKYTVRGMATLQDAGEELIAKTFVSVYDFHFIDRGKEYSVSMDCYLYRLVWDDAAAGIFYGNCWIDKGTIAPDPAKVKAFDNSADFRLKFVGQVNITSEKFDKPITQTVVNGYTKYSTGGINEVSSNIQYITFNDFFKNHWATLEEKFEEFRTIFPLYSADPIAAKIGTKEDVKAGDKFEVIEKIRNSDGSLQYKQIGTISIVDKNKIWDNNTIGDWLGSKSKLEYTVFEGQKEKYAPGMLFRKIYPK